MKALYRLILPFVMPAVVFSSTLLLFLKWPYWMDASGPAGGLKALSIIFPYLPYIFSGAAMVLGWRFHQTGMMLSGLLVGTAYGCVHQGWCPPETGFATILSCLALTEIAVFSAWRWRQLPLKNAFFWVATLLLQPICLAGFQRLMNAGDTPPGDILSSPLLAHLAAAVRRIDLPAAVQTHPPIFVLCLAGTCLLFQAVKKRDVLSAGLLGVLLSVFWGLGATQSLGKAPVFFSAAGLILMLSCIEASFIMAYRDDLTGLPSRRALNQALAGLGGNYTIAMIDVDRFKRFNDTYGHKTGDQVLKLLATRLTRMTGGAKAFRYGGEEFTAVFPGKSMEDALPHLEACRQQIAETPFTVRGRTRRASNPKKRGKSKRKTAAKRVKITASFGVSQPGSTLKTPTQVVAAADKALYRAKKAGRNRIKT